VSREVTLEEYPVPTLKHAPITEAVIDIRVMLSSAADVKSIGLLFEKIKDQYPIKQEQRVSEFSLDLKPGEDPIKASTQRITGYRYVSADKKQIVQARLDGFSLSRLHPYAEWMTFRDEAKKLWQIYQEIMKPAAITRVALRYINNLNMPYPINDFDEYLTAPPTVPKDLPQGISSFLTRMVVTEPALGINAIITQALELVPPMPEINRLPVILDIDVFKQDPKGMEEADAWHTIEQLRHFKNKIFDKSITPKLKET
jgi:uncharacterized protein (TIGR04255 family)